MKKAYFIIIILLTSFSIQSQSTNSILDSLAQTIVEKYNLPSLTVSYIKKDTCFYGQNGNININSKNKVRLTDKYHLGSNTKAITSLIAFKLIENKKITLDTKLVDLFPELKKKIKRQYCKITLSNLLSHNARVQPYTSGIEFENLTEFTGTISEKRFAFTKYVLNQKTTKRGTYSNAGYIIASLMLEKCSNNSFEELVKEMFSEMKLDYFIGFPNKEFTESTWGHWEENNKLIALPPTHSYTLEDYALPAGDISMNIIDYSQFVQKHLNGLLGIDNYLVAKSYNDIHYKKVPYSYGWKNQINKKGKMSFHDGSAGTYFCHTIISSTHEFAIIIFINSAEENHVKGVYELRNEIFKIRSKIR